MHTNLCTLNACILSYPTPICLRRMLLSGTHIEIIRILRLLFVKWVTFISTRQALTLHFTRTLFPDLVKFASKNLNLTLKTIIKWGYIEVEWWSCWIRQSIQISARTCRLWRSAQGHLEYIYVQCFLRRIFCFEEVWTSSSHCSSELLSWLICYFFFQLDFSLNLAL